jgi:hypothetical protein
MAAKKPENRSGTGKFESGKSGNPGGRPKKTKEELDLIAACKERAPAALAVIEHLMMEAEKDDVKLKAALAIIERAYGKPVVSIEGTGEDGKLVIEVVRFADHAA